MPPSSSSVVIRSPGKNMGGLVARLFLARIATNCWDDGFQPARKNRHLVGWHVQEGKTHSLGFQAARDSSTRYEGNPILRNFQQDSGAMRERFTSQDTTSAFAQIRRDPIELRP